MCDACLAIGEGKEVLFLQLPCVGRGVVEVIKNGMTCSRGVAGLGEC